LAIVLTALIGSIFVNAQTFNSYKKKEGGEGEVRWRKK